jgi:hypothetical protein
MLVIKPISGLGYNTGVKNKKNVMEIDNILPMSRIIPFKMEKINDNPKVNNNNGKRKKGKKRILIFG